MQRRIYIKRVHVLISGVCVRRELIFPYVIFVIIIRFCLRRKAWAVSGVSDSPTSYVSRITREKLDFE